MSIHESGGNFKNLVDNTYDEDGNLLSCPRCGCTHLIKKGKDTKTQGQPRRYQCKDCGFKTARPKRTSNFILESLILACLTAANFSFLNLGAID